MVSSKCGSERPNRDSPNNQCVGGAQILQHVAELERVAQHLRLGQRPAPPVDQGLQALARDGRRR